MYWYLGLACLLNSLYTIHLKSFTSVLPSGIKLCKFFLFPFDLPCNSGKLFWNNYPNRTQWSVHQQTCMSWEQNQQIKRAFYEEQVILAGSTHELASKIIMESYFPNVLEYSRGKSSQVLYPKSSIHLKLGQTIKLTSIWCKIKLLIAGLTKHLVSY